MSKKHEPITKAIANVGLPRFHRDRLCWLKQLKSLYTFPEKPGQLVLADFEQQFNPVFIISSAVEH